MNTQQLICFICVADRLNFTKAAEELFLSTPTVTHQIKTLESELKAPLFIRNSKMVQLTEAGQRFYKDAKEILSKFELAEKKVQYVTASNTHFFHIGCTSHAEFDYLRLPLSTLMQKFPGICPRIYVNDYFTLKEMFENSQLDVMLATRNMIRNFTNCEFTKIRTVINYALFLPSSHLRSKNELFFKDLSEDRIITLHPKLVPFEHSNKIRDKILEHELNHLDIHCEDDRSGIFLAECGYGVAIFPEFCIENCSNILEKCPFEKDSIFYDYGIAYHKKGKNDYTKYFLDTL